MYSARARFLTRSRSLGLSATLLVAFDDDPICRFEEGQRHARLLAAALDHLDGLARNARYDVALLGRVVGQPRARRGAYINMQVDVHECFQPIHAVARRRHLYHYSRDA